MIKKFSSKVVYKNKWMSVREDKVVFPNGEKGIYSVVDKASFALIIPMFENGFQLVNQYRYPVSARYWEFPQGAYEEQPHIDPAILAQQELKEETGLSAHTLQKIGFFHEAYGYSSQGFHIFLATELEAGDTKRETGEQDMITKRVTFSEFGDMILTGAIVDAPTISAYALLKIKKIIS